MRIVLGAVIGSASRQKIEPAFELLTEYLERASQYLPCRYQTFTNEGELLQSLEKRSGRTTTNFWAFDRTGAEMTSEQFAERLRKARDGGQQELLIGIGPASGWSGETRAKASATLSLGKITLPHKLAQAVVAEQIYRGLTILANHPYHCGH